MENFAIIIPYRDRKIHLNEFLRTNLPNIFVIEQKDKRKFNAGKLKNIGFDLLKDKFDYFVFHDVDIIPIEFDYSYPKVPTRIWSKRYLYENYFGGIVLFNKEDFISVNGYGNNYWGWGVEDDDIFDRVKNKIGKWETRDGVFEILEHQDSYVEEDYFKNLVTKNTDNSGLDNLNYYLKGIEEFKNYNKINVELDHSATAIL